MNVQDANFNAVISDIAEHYQHACDKHPYFADVFVRRDAETYEQDLEMRRNRLSEHIETHDVSTVDVLCCELSEVYNAYTHGEIKQAREECLDAIAVLIRMIDIIDGLQPLGNPDANRCPDTACPHNDSRGVCLHKGGTAKCFKVEGGAK